MDMKTLEEMAKGKRTVSRHMTLYERAYYVALRGLYSQYKAREVDLEQAEDDKVVLEDVFGALLGDSMAGKEIVHLNKEYVVDAVILETGRYIAAGNTNADRGKAYPRKLFEERVKLMVDRAYERPVG